MANPTSLERPPIGKRYDPTAIDATGATLGDALIAVDDGSGGKRAGYGAVGGAPPTGAAGGVLAGTYPNPSFAADMATQAELDAGLALKAPLASPALTGVPTVPTAAPGTNTTQAASTAFVEAAVIAGGGYTDEQAQDAVGAMIADTATVNLTYTDATPELKADVIDDSITFAKLQNIATNRILGRTTASSGDVEELTIGTGITVTGTTLSVTAPPATFAGARVYNSANISIANNTSTGVLCDSEREDSDGFHSTVTNTDRLTVAAGLAGRYMIGGGLEWASNNNGIRLLIIELNGTTNLVVQGAYPLQAGNNTYIAASTMYTLADGDYVRLVAYQTSGGSLNINAAGNYAPEFWMYRIAA